MDFNNHIVHTWKFGDNSFLFTETMRNSLIVSAILIIFSICVRIAIDKFNDTPKGFQNFVETAVESFSGLVNSILPKNHAYFGNWFFMVFAFVFVSNQLGLLGLRPPTADYATTFALAFISFICVHTTGIIQQKGEYWKAYLHPIPVFLPVNLLGAVAILLSLSFRLFGNILGGTIILGMVYALPFYVKLGIPVFLHMYFDIFAGSLQALIFTMLGLLFINEKMPEKH